MSKINSEHINSAKVKGSIFKRLTSGNSKFNLDNPALYDSKEINFIKIFFKILVVFVALVLLCFLVLPVNDSINFKYGEIISDHPQADFKAPFEVIPKKTFVSIGDRVQKGDTLMLVDNANGEFVTLYQQNRAIDIDKLNIQEKIDFYRTEINLYSTQYRLNTEKISNELASINQRVALLNEQENLKRNKLSSDSIMYKKEVISLIDLRSAYDDYLTTKNQVLQNQNFVSQLQSQYSSLENEYLQKKNALEIQISDLIASQNRLMQQKENVNSKLITNEKAIDFVQSESNKQYLISNINGIVISVFTQNQNLSYINKGESLIAIAPETQSFYARALVKEQDLKYLKVGQTTHLKLDAYYYYQYGPIKGAVSYIPVSKDFDNNFYVLIDLPSDQVLNLRSGYSFKGDIILEKMVLGSYIIKKIFERYDSQISVEKDVVTKKQEAL